MTAPHDNAGTLEPKEGAMIEGSPEQICSAEVVTSISDRTEVKAGCGLTREQHLGVHIARHQAPGNVIGTVLVTFTWTGEFKA